MATDIKSDTPEPVAVTEQGTDAIVRPGDAANKAIRVNVVAQAGGGGGLTDTQLRASPVPVSGSFSASTSAKATAAAPTYTEGVDSPISQDLAGNLRTLATVSTAGLATETTLAAVSTDTADMEASLASLDTKLTNPLPVSAAALPLPAGAATETTLGSLLADTVDMEASLASLDTKLTNPLPVSGVFWQATQPVSGAFYQATQPVSGAFYQATQPVSATVLPLPAGAATGAKQDTEIASLASIDGKLANPLPVTGAFYQATQPVSGPLTDTQLRASPIPITGSITATSAATATAAAPAYAEGVPSALSQDLAGNLRVVQVGGTTFFTAFEDSIYNGTDLTLTLGHTPTGPPQVFVGGLLWYVGTNYTRVGSTITWITYPNPGEAIEVVYPWAMASSTMNAMLWVDPQGNPQTLAETNSKLNEVLQALDDMQWTILDALH